LALEAGFIPERDPNLVIDALDRERRAELNKDGDFVFSRQDQVDAQEWRDASGAASDAEAEIVRREEIKRELEKNGKPNASEEEVALISEYMARNGIDYDEASERIGIQLESRISELQDRYNQDVVTSSPYADRKASDDAAAIKIDEDDEIYFEDYETIVTDLEQRDLLSDNQKVLLEEIRAIDAEAQARVEVIDAVTACVVRSS